MSEDATNRTPAGWYPDPKMAGTQRYWDGDRWTENVAPQGTPTASSAGIPSQLVVALVLAAAVGGFILSQQSVSLISGTGIVWTGTAICIAAAIVCWVVKAIPTWTRVICVLAAIGALASAIYVESEMSDRRDELSNLFDE